MIWVFLKTKATKMKIVVLIGKILVIVAVEETEISVILLGKRNLMFLIADMESS